MVHSNSTGFTQESTRVQRKA